eukprot:g14921.t1
MRLLLPSSAVFPSPSSSVSDPSVVPRPQILFRRRPPPDAEARPPVRPDPVSRPAPRPRPQEDDARPVRAHAAPPGLMKATTQPESELLFSIAKTFRAVSAQGVAQRVPYGAPPRQPHPTTSPPSQLAAPVVKPHNAWCTFITWVEPASGPDDDDFTYELHVRNAESEHCLLIAEIGQDGALDSSRDLRDQRGVSSPGSAGAAEWPRSGADLFLPGPCLQRRGRQ